NRRKSFTSNRKNVSTSGKLFEYSSGEHTLPACNRRRQLADEIQLRVAHSLPAVCGRRARWFARLAQTNSSFRFNISPFRHAEIYFVVEAAVSAARLHSRRS